MRTELAAGFGSEGFGSSPDIMSFSAAKQCYLEWIPVKIAGDEQVVASVLTSFQYILRCVSLPVIGHTSLHSSFCRSQLRCHS